MQQPGGPRVQEQVTKLPPWAEEFRVRGGMCELEGPATEGCWENLAACVCFDMLNRHLSLSCQV